MDRSALVGAGIFVTMVFGFLAVLLSTSAYTCYGTGANTGTGTVDRNNCLSDGKDGAYLVFGLGCVPGLTLILMGSRRPPTPSPTPS